MSTAEIAPGKSLWLPENRRTTSAVLLLITIVAFEQLGISTAMPRMLADLDGTSLYSWPFTVFLSASVVSTVVCGRIADRVGPARVLYVAPAVFLVGLLVAGTADTMAVLLVARALQGAGMGAEATCIYVLITLVYPERSRPAAFGALSAAWVVPSIVGPTVAGVVTEQVGWRWVFLGLAPLAVLGALLLLPALRGLPRPDRSGTPAGRRWLPVAAVAAGVAIPVVSWAAQHPSPLWLVAGVVGVVVLVAALRTLLPKGTLRAARGLPRVVLSRGLFAGAFLAVEAFLPLTLASVHGYPLALAGLPLTIAALGWSGASHWQGRHPEVERSALIRWGFVVLGVALAAMTLVAVPGGPGWLAVPLWLFAGAGMGMAFPAISVLALGRAPEHERGFVSAAVQVIDTVFAATTIALGGVLLAGIASAAEPTAAVVVLDLLMAAMALGGALLFRRVRDAAV
ncbi:MFS transporter [Actinokineospora spheciospongiae]|uniref:MFS transporter n=1 Tax=Actinokineospora spheciospongiae TaxID=909613 RepID=UPI000D71161F|nr:MFS transporter [Actinokineospora spheciospongiae]PWW55430.1 MFS transporter [Actinokineospora spheciospongiae]